MRHILKIFAVILAIGLSASAASAAAVTLHWTAPGDDSLTGRATRYDMRRNTVPITAANWLSSLAITNMPAPASPGLREGITIMGLAPNTNYYFALKTQDDAGNWSLMSNVVLKNTSSQVDVPDSPGQPSSPVTVLHFSAPRPNPARSNAAFSLGLPQAADVHVAAFDIQGRNVKILMSGSQPAGEHRLVWNLDDSDGRHLAPGVYMVRARLGTEWFERRVTVVD